jgi:hypothetical protein
MAEDLIKHGPNVIHPETESAVGSRNSMVRDGRDEYSEARLMIDESVDKVLNHIHAKLPPEVLSRLDVMGGIKAKLHTYFNQNYQNMLNRFLTTMEDELGKKVRDLVDMEELRALNRYAPRGISYLLDRIAGPDKFNTAEVEKSIVNMYGHLHGHVQREMNDLETHTNSLLRRKTDVGAFVRGENAYAIVKCSFRDHPEKPESVYQVKLALNILDAELVSRIYPYQVEVSTLIKDLIAKHVTDALTKELQAINENLVDEGKAELRPEEKIFERIKALDNHTSDDDSENSRRYTHVAKKVLDAVEGIRAEIPFEEYDPLKLRENVRKLIEDENIRNRGFNTAVNAMTHILDWSRMGYQHIENYRFARAILIREYAETNVELLPDERYEMKLEFYDQHQLRSMREAYQLQLQELERTIGEVWEVVEKIYVEHREESGKDDWETFSKRLLEKPERRSWFAPRGEEEEAPPVETGPAWNEITFIQPKLAQSVSEYPTMIDRFTALKGRFPVMRERLSRVFEEDNPDLRMIVEGRIDFLQGEFSRFAALVNPFHIQPGLLLDLDIVTIKRRSSTMMTMANVLNEFLYTVSQGFADQAFAEFSRRRSTQRADMAEEFVSGTGTSEGAEAGEEVFE